MMAVKEIIKATSLGKVRVSGSAVVRGGEEQPQLYTLDKRSLFSHVRGELSLKLYLSTKEEVKQVVSGGETVSGGVVSKKNKKSQQQGGSLVVPKNMGQETGKITHMKPVEPGPGDLKPVVITNMPGPVIPSAGGGYFRGGISNDYSLKETSPHLGGGGLSRDKTSSTYDLVEQMQYLYIRVVKAKDLLSFVSGGGERHRRLLPTLPSPYLQAMSLI